MTRIEMKNTIESQRGQSWLEKNKPNWAVSVLVAEFHSNQSDPMVDYFASSIEKNVLLAWSSHNRDLFPEMRKAAANFSETAALATAPPDVEHREKYSMGSGYFLQSGSKYSGWRVKKLNLAHLPAGFFWRCRRDPIETAPPVGAGCEGECQSVTRAEVQAHYHTKRKCDFWLVVTNRVGHATYRNLKWQATERGGWYSRKWKETPGGYAFDSLDAAKQFCNLILTKWSTKNEHNN